jgi:hypothetical protein
VFLFFTLWWLEKEEKKKGVLGSLEILDKRVIL